MGYDVKVVFILFCIFLLASCSSSRDLGSEQYALVKNTFSLKTDDERVDKSRIKKDIKGLVKQNPVRKGALNPRTWRTPLTIYDAELSAESATSMQQYLRNRKGFYHAEVNFHEKKKGQKFEVIYHINLGPRYYISDITMEGQDTTLLQLFAQHNQNTKIKVGDPLDARIFDQEEVRLIDIAKNNGYAEFSPNYIEFRGDSSNYEVPVKIYVYNPINRDKHQAYRIGEINVYTEHVAQELTSKRVDTLPFQNYHSKLDEFIVTPSSISRSMSLREGAIFSRKDEFLTNRTLSRLSPYRFVTIDPQISPVSDSIYNYNIFLTPHDHKWVFDMGGNLFYSLLNQAPSVSERDLFGFGGNLGWENRNFRRRAISHRFGLEGSFEFAIPTFAANTFSFQANNTFRVPHIVDVLKLAPFLNRVGLLTDRSFKNLNLYGRTDVDFSLGLTKILNAYTLNSLNASWSYTFQPDDYNRYIWTQLGINVLDTRVDSVFQATILDPNPLLNKSFSDYLFTALLVKEVNIYKQSKETLGGSYFAFLGNFELSGLENLFINKLVNWTTGYNDRWSLGNLEFSEFIRMDGDIRFYKKVKERSTFAARFNMGIALSYGDDDVVPFVKSFFVGGPNSLRGWQLRELGPGAYSKLLIDPVQGQPFFQTGDFKMEFNLEYRFDLFWFWEGAVFLDAGNVWTLEADEQRPGSQLSGKFLDQMAMSTGWGLRFDFEYFLLRFDFGYKLRNPFPDPETNSHIILTNGKYNGILGNVNFAINYPF